MIESELSVIGAMPGNCDEIALRTGINGRTVRDITRRLCLRDQAHICGYQRRAKGGDPYPIFSRGKGVAAALPEPVTASGRRRRNPKPPEQDDFAEARAMIANRIAQHVARNQPAQWFSPLLKATA